MGLQSNASNRSHPTNFFYIFLIALMSFTDHDDFNTDKVCNSANPTQVGFVHIYEPCILVTFNAFYVTSHWESQPGSYFQNRFLRSKH